MCPLNIRLGPPPAPSRMPSTFARPSSTCCHCTRRPISSERVAHELGHRLLVAREARRADRPAGPVDEPVAVDRDRSRDFGAAEARTRGRTCSPNRRICSCRFSPQSSSMMCVQPAARYSSIAATQSSGVPAIGLQRSRIESVTFALAASRPPCSIASATGRISSGSIPASSSSVSAEPWMFCTLFARYMPAISRAPSRPASRSVAWIEATIVQPTSTEAGSRPALSAPIRTLPQRVARRTPGVVIDGVRRPSPISPPSCCMRGAVPAT